MDKIADHDQALESNADCPYAHFRKIDTKTVVGDWERGWPEFEWRWKSISICSANCPSRNGWSPLGGRNTPAAC